LRYGPVALRVLPSHESNQIMAKSDLFHGEVDFRRSDLWPAKLGVVETIGPVFEVTHRGSRVRKPIRPAVHGPVRGLDVFDHIPAARFEVRKESLKGSDDVPANMASIVHNEVKGCKPRDKFAEKVRVILVPLDDRDPIFLEFRFVEIIDTHDPAQRKVLLPGP
jgi:hypothetical protein